MRRRYLALAATIIAGGFAAGSALPAAAQSSFPDRPITLLVGFPPGGNIDIAARLSAPFLEKHLGNNARIAVVNKPGAASVVMLNDLAASRPDGHTVGILSLPGMVTAMLDSRPRYSTDSFTYLGALTDEPYTLFVAPNGPYKTLQELAAAARANPGGVTLGAAGVGSAPHLALVQWQRAANLRFNYAPFPGAAQAVAAVQGGHIVGSISTVSLTVRMHKDNTARILGIMSAERWNRAADVPTFRENGFNVIAGAARGIGGPAGMPAEIAQRWAEAIRKTAEDPEFQAIVERDNLILRYQTAAEFRDFVKNEERVFGEIWRTNPWR